MNCEKFASFFASFTSFVVAFCGLPFSLLAIALFVLPFAKVILVFVWLKELVEDDQHQLNPLYTERHNTLTGLVATIGAFSTIQLFNFLIFSHRPDKVYLSCASVLAIDVLPVILGSVAWSTADALSIAEPKSPPTSHLLLTINSTIGTVIQLCTHFGVLFYFARLLPLSERLPNRQLPTVSKRELRKVEQQNTQALQPQGLEHEDHRPLAIIARGSEARRRKTIKSISAMVF
jgi:hypothetical protein